MPMRPIDRIPMEIDSPPLHAMVHAELNSAGNSTATREFAAALHYSSGDDNHLEILLDWAMQIRTEMGIDWASSIRAASILYFG